jgi:hypothetical protein
MNSSEDEGFSIPKQQSPSADKENLFSSQSVMQASSSTNGVKRIECSRRADRARMVRAVVAGALVALAAKPSRKPHDRNLSQFPRKFAISARESTPIGESKS